MKKIKKQLLRNIAIAANKRGVVTGIGNLRWDIYLKRRYNVTLDDGRKKTLFGYSIYNNYNGRVAYLELTKNAKTYLVVYPNGSWSVLQRDKLFSQQWYCYHKIGSQQCRSLGR